MRDNNINYETIEYLKEKLTITTLSHISRSLNLNPKQLIRTYDKNFKSLNIDINTLSDSQVFTLIVKNPNILERPIIIKKDKAVIGRPPENLLNWI